MPSNTIKNAKLTRKEIKRGLKILRRHAIDKPQLPESLPRVSIGEYYDIGICTTQAEINKVMKNEKKWVMRHGDEEMKVDFPVTGEREWKGGRRTEKVAKVCERTKIEVKDLWASNKWEVVFQ